MSELLLTKHGTVEPALTDDMTELDMAVARPVIEFVAAVNRGHLDAAVDQLAPDALHYGRVSNYRPDGVRVLFNMLRTVFPDLRLDIRDMRVEGNRVITRIVATGTHTGSFLGKKPTGQPMTWESVDIAETDYPDADETGFRRIMKRFWDIWNDPNLWKKIGFIPAINC
jgi:predicted ester cyclase